MKCTFKGKGRCTDPNCPKHGKRKKYDPNGAQGSGHDKVIPGKKRQRQSGGQNTGAILKQSEPVPEDHLKNFICFFELLVVNWIFSFELNCDWFVFEL